jgi:hypothetical protein
MFNPKDADINRGNYSPGFHGVDLALYGDKATKIPGNMSQRFQDYCTYGDPVCNYNLLFVPTCAPSVTMELTCAHLRYPELGWVDDSVPGVLANLAVVHVL